MDKLKSPNIFFAALWLIAGLAVPVLVQAQTPDPVQYIVAPETPGPNAPVQILVQGVGTFLGNANITWDVNGKTVQQGVGLTSVSFQTGALGTQTTVRLTIDSQTQGVITKTFTFSPSTINLIWESDTSAPPLFAGKTLYSAGSPLSITAFPTVIRSGARVSAASLSYQWSVNETPLPDDSGTGKNTLSYTGDELQSSEQVAIDVYLGNDKVGHGEITIPAVQPQLVLYNQDPLRGVVWESALPQSGIALNGKEITIQAQPYYFSTSALTQSGLTWSWALDGAPITGPDSSQGLLTLRQTGSGQGEAQLTVSLQNNSTSQLLQSASAALRIVFGNQTSSILSSFFGL